MHDPGIHADDRAGREECVVELQTGGECDALQVETEGGVHVEAFSDDSGEALELLAFGPGGRGRVRRFEEWAIFSSVRRVVRVEGY